MTLLKESGGAEGEGRRQRKATFLAGALLFLFGFLGMTTDFRQNALGAAAPLWCILLGLCESFPQSFDQAWQCAGRADPQPLGSLGKIFEKIQQNHGFLRFLKNFALACGQLGCGTWRLLGCGAGAAQWAWWTRRARRCRRCAAGATRWA